MRFQHQRAFLYEVMLACQATDHTKVHTVIFVDDDSAGLARLDVTEKSVPVVSRTDQLFAGRHDYGAIATLVGDRGVDVWMLVVMARGRSGVFLVGHIEEQRWEELDTHEIPWFAAATAGSLRGALDGEPLGPFKRAADGDATLFAPVTQGALPPTDGSGRI